MPKHGVMALTDARVVSTLENPTLYHDGTFVAFVA